VRGDHIRKSVAQRIVVYFQKVSRFLYRPSIKCTFHLLIGQFCPAPIRRLRSVMLHMLAMRQYLKIRWIIILPIAIAVMNYLCILAVACLQQWTTEDCFSNQTMLSDPTPPVTQMMTWAVLPDIFAKDTRIPTLMGREFVQPLWTWVKPHVHSSP
jgi:hypothetical protein